MKLLRLAILPLIGILLAAPSANATHCRQQVIVQKQVVAAEVVYPVVQQVVVPVYGLIPLYQPAAYVAPAPVQAQQAVTESDVLRELLVAVKELRGEVQAIRSGAPPAKVEAPKIDTDAVVKSMRKACANCHNPASADMDGGGLTLFKSDGAFAGVDPAMAKRLARRVSVGSMPPAPAKLDDADKKLIVDAFKQ